MSNVLIVCPTVTGREESLERCKESYTETLKDHSVRFSIPVDCPTWGEGVNEGIQSADEVYGFEMCDFIHLTADDLEAHDGWFEAASNALSKGVYPAPMLMNPDGSVFSFGHGDANMHDVSRDWKPTHTSVIPTITPLMWRMMGPMIPLHFFTDDYMSHRARQIGMNTVAIMDYKFTHHASEIHAGAGIGRDKRMAIDQEAYQHYLRTGKMK